MVTIAAALFHGAYAQRHAKKSKDRAALVNVFLGTSGDHGQLSPAASSPFGLLSIGPQTNPKLHAGYEHKAVLFEGFTHNRFEGVGCEGSGGNILIKPILGNNKIKALLIKKSESAGPGYYRASFTNGLQVSIAVDGNAGQEEYIFPGDSKAFILDLSHTLANHFVNEAHEFSSNAISGWVESKTTCNVGVYRQYYYFSFDREVRFKEIGSHQFTVSLSGAQQVLVKVAFSSVDVAHAKAKINGGSFAGLLKKSSTRWETALNHIRVEGDNKRVKLFYSLLYRTLQSPYMISEPDGSYRAIDGSLQRSVSPVYHGWTVWDNYKTQLPLLCLAYPEYYQPIINSLAGLYRYGKKDFATSHEPSNTVRTEHTVVMLLDAHRKGYTVDFGQIKDSLLAEAARLDFSKPDKALESCYDAWAVSQILRITGDTLLSRDYHKLAAGYRDYWIKDFKDVSKKDVDRMQARNLYQGTIWQYRWAVPFDIKGLINLAGGETTFKQQLDFFFEGNYYNHANEPDIQAPLLYNALGQPWKSQRLVHKYAVDTVVQYYFNNNSRGIDPFIEQIYQNRPEAYVRTMDDDGGAMSSWFVLASCGVFPACPGWPVYYLNAPLFPKVTINWDRKHSLTIQTKNFSAKAQYIKEVYLNGKKLNRNWITHQEIMRGGSLTLIASEQPSTSWGTQNSWLTDMEQTQMKF